MSAKPNKRQIKVTADLMGRTLHALDELNLPYAVVVQGVDLVFTNTTPASALALQTDAVELATKIREEVLNSKAESAAAILGYPRRDE